MSVETTDSAGTKQDLRPYVKRSLTAIESNAREVLRQCQFLRKNGGCDTIRFGFIHLASVKCEEMARREWSRWQREYEKEGE